MTTTTTVETFVVLQGCGCGFYCPILVRTETIDGDGRAVVVRRWDEMATNAMGPARVRAAALARKIGVEFDDEQIW